MGFTGPILNERSCDVSAEASSALAAAVCCMGSLFLCSTEVFTADAPNTQLHRRQKPTIPANTHTTTEI